MLAAERRRRITETVRSEHFVSTDGLSAQLSVSSETIRRDLIALEQNRVLTRVHGGAASLDGAVVEEEPSFTQRNQYRHDAKDIIARAAVSLIVDKRTVFIDVGTTGLAVARAIPRTFRGTVTTNSLHVAADLADRTQAEVYVTGGRVRPGDLAISSPSSLDLMHETYSEIAILGSGGVDIDAGLTDFNEDEAVLRRAIILNSRESYVLVDSTKFAKVARIRVANFEQLTGIVTDSEPPAPLRKAMVDAGMRIIVGSS